MQIPPHWVVSSQRLICIVLVCLLGGAAQCYAQPAGVVAFNKDTELGVCIAISPDEKHLYAGGIGSLVVFERGLGGVLRVVQVLNNDHMEIDGISEVSEMVVSRDGRYLYAVNQLQSRVNLFARDSVSGQIRWIDFFTDEIFYGDVYNISHYELIQNPNGSRLYWLNTNGDSNRAHNVLAVLERDWVTGKLNRIQTLHGGEAELGFYQTPLALTMTPDGKNLYGCGKNGPFLLAFRCDTLNGKITWTKALPVNLGTVTDWDRGSITVSPDGGFIYVTNMFADKFFVVARSPENDKLQVHSSLSFSKPSTSFLSPDGKFLYLLNSGVIASFTREASSGNLTRVGDFQLRNSTSTHNVVVSSIGQNIYLNVHIDVNGSNIQAFERDPSSGSLKIIQQVDDLGGTDRLSGGRAVEVSPQGGHLYVGTDSDAALNVFARDQARGRLTLVEADSVGQISSMKVSPRGEHLYATTQKNELKTFAVNPSTGAINLVQTLTDTVRQYHTLSFSPDGLQLYLADFKRVKVFARDPISGSLSGVQSFVRAGLWHNRAVALEVSLEGRHVYWQSGDELSMLKRDPSNGKLFFGDSLLLRVPGYELAGGQRALQIAPDGKHVYAGVTAYRYFDDGDHFAHPKVLSFERNAQSGALTLVEVVASHKWQRWDLMRDLALSADGKELYAVLDSEGDSYAGLAMLTRDVETGKLTQRDFFEVIKGGLGYDGPLTDAALSPDGGFMYFTDQIGVTTFATGRRIISRVHDNNVFIAAPPRVLNLAQNYPNPFALAAQPRATVIHYEIAANEGAALPVELAIYNLQGQHVVTLVRQTQARGKYSAEWSGLNARGAIVPAGIYFYRLKAGEHVMTKKLVVR